MTTKHYIATVHLLVTLDDSVPGMGICQASACDAISELLWNVAEIKDWGYARTSVRVPGPLPHPTSDERWAYPVAVDVPENYDEGEFYDAIPTSHRIGG